MSITEKQALTVDDAKVEVTREGVAVNGPFQGYVLSNGRRRGSPRSQFQLLRRRVVLLGSGQSVPPFLKGILSEQLQNGVDCKSEGSCKGDLKEAGIQRWSETALREIKGSF